MPGTRHWGGRQNPNVERRSNLRIRAKGSHTLKGFGMQSSAPASGTSTIAADPVLNDMAMMCTCENRRKERQNVMPSRMVVLMSVTTRSGSPRYFAQPV